MTSVTNRGAVAVRRHGPSALLTLPTLIFFGVFAIIPLFVALYLSFTSWNGLGSPEWIGGENWATLVSTPGTWHSIWLTLVLMVISWIIQTPISLLLGVFLSGHQRYREIFAVIYFVPLLLSSAAIAITFRNLLDPNFGLFSSPALSWLNLNWLGDPNIALYTIAFIIAWQFIPLHTLLYQGGARQIPQTLYEAAAIDGAGRARQFFSITLPQLRYTIVTSTTLMLVGALTYFDIIFILTQGGPGNATRILPLDMYLTGFVGNQMGLASAIAIVLVVAGMALSLGISKFSGFTRMESQLDGE